jgi:hypothetical protein
MNKIGLAEVKKALKDGRFRDSLPSEMQPEVMQWLNNPGCPCNVPFYRKLLKEAKPQLQKYYPGQDIVDEQEEIVKVAQNHWSVINCHIDELEGKLRKLGPGRKQIDVARFEDQVTVVVNDLDLIY